MDDIHAEYERLFTERPELRPKDHDARFLEHCHSDYWEWGLARDDSQSVPEHHALRIIRDSLREWLNQKGSVNISPPLKRLPWAVNGHMGETIDHALIASVRSIKP